MLRLLTVVAVLGTLAFAQNTSPRPVVRIDSGAGLQHVDGELLGLGDAYKVRFQRDTVEYVPAFGDRTPHNLPLRLSLISAGREGATMPAADVDPVRDGMHAAYARPGHVERWHVRPEGVEFTVTFPIKPAGHGDLVVRLDVDTELEPAATRSANEAVRWAREGVGAVAMGHVFGVDADGRRVDGSIRRSGRTLELSLPAEFVDTASYPLVLDPLLGPSGSRISGGLNIDSTDPDVAWDPTNQRYLVVFSRKFSSGDWDVLGRFLDSSGNFVSGYGTIFIDGAVGKNSLRPKVANVRDVEKFVVVWEEDNDIQGRAVSARDATMGSTISIAASSDTERFPDIGGDSTGRTDEAVVVFHNQTDNNIQARRLIVLSSSMISSTGATIGLGGLFGGVVGAPEISQTSGPEGATPRYLAVYHGTSRSNTFNRVLMIGLDSRLNTLGPTLAVGSSASGPHRLNPDVAGDGTDWVVAYERYEGTSRVRDIVCVGIAYDPHTSRTFSRTVESPVQTRQNDDTAHPAVCWVDGSVLVAFRDTDTGGSADMQIMSLDPFTCRTCEDAELLQTTNNAFDVAMASNHGNSLGRALVVWESVADDFHVVGNVWSARDGNERDWGGGAGAGGGEARSTCARIGEFDFFLRLRNATPNAPAAVLVGPNVRIELPCGSGLLVPNPLTSFVFVTATDANGRAELHLPIPRVSDLANVRFLQQWLVTPLGTPGCAALGLDFSNAVEIRFDN